MSRSSTLAPSQNVSELVHKLHDADSDIRYMSLSDLRSIFSNPSQSAFLTQDYTACARIIDGLLHTLVDSNGEVQNMTVNCIGPLVQRVHPGVLAPMIHKFSTLENTESVDISISALAIRSIVVSLPRPAPGIPRSKSVTDAYDAVSKVLVPRLVGHIVIPRRDKDLPDPPKGLLEEDLEKGRDSNAIDVLTEVARCFGPLLQDAEVQALQHITIKVLENDRAGSTMKKKAVTALSALSHFFSEMLLSSVISHLIEALRDPHLTSTNRKLIINIFGSMARAIPVKFGTHLKTLAPFVIAAVSEQEMNEQMQGVEEDEERDPQADEVREAALSALESFIGSCTREMERYMPECIDAALRYMKYDPVIADDEEEDEEDMKDADDEFELDEDFEEEVGADDEDDVSWKARRVAAKTLYTIISVRGRDLLENGPLYDRIATALIGRFREREETVRIEVLSTIGFLVRKTGDGLINVDTQLANGVEHALALQTASRKRRRANSDISMSDPRKFGRLTGSNSPETRASPPAGPSASLAKIGIDMTNGLLKLIKTSTPSTKQTAMSVLKDLVIARQGGFDQLLANMIPPLVETIESPGSSGKSSGPALPSGSGSTTGTTLQTEALQLLAEILKAHSSKLFQPHLPSIIRAVLKTIGETSPRVASEGLLTLEQLVKALTPPRAASINQQSSAQVDQILSATVDLINSRNTDLAVRKDAIHVLGILLGRTFGSKGSKVLPQQRRSAALDVLYDTCRNETTRYAAIRAVNAMAGQAAGDKTGFDGEWTSKICLELAAQLRKADRALRGASLAALKTLLADSGTSSSIDASSEEQLLGMLIPLLTSEDLHMVGPDLLVIAAIVSGSPRNIVNHELVDHIGKLAASPIASSALTSLCALVEAIGRRGAAQPLMQKLLQDVGIKASSTAVVGKLIGTLLVSGGRTVGVKSEDFLKEVKQAVDEQRRSLALAVLGEIGLRSGAQAGLTSDLFFGYFASKTPEVQLAAANALGRAAAGYGNVKSWVPAILQRIKQNPGEQYLALHAIRELLQHNENDKEILPFAGQLWDSALSASREREDNRALGAECIANLVMIDPPEFLTALQSLLSDRTASIRAIAILAFRDVFTATDSTYDKDLRPITVELLTTMLRDSDVENRRSALNTFSAAVRNKAHLILPHLATLLPLVLDQSHKDPSLIREVSMGPFKHTVDDGLEVRKNAYETLYSLLEIAPGRILVDPAIVSALFDRTIAGVGDDRGIQTLSNLMLPKLAASAPEEMTRRLDAVAEQFRTVLAFKPKETAVRPEVEKAEDAKRGVVKVSLELAKLLPGEVPDVGVKTGSGAGAGQAGAGSVSNTANAGLKPVWSGYWEFMMTTFGELVKQVEKESKEGGRGV